MAYERNPRYAPVGGTVQLGWAEAVASLGRQPVILAVDGPQILDWGSVVDGIRAALRERNVDVRFVDMRDHFAPWPTVVDRTDLGELPGDPHFARLPDGTLADLLEGIPAPDLPTEGVLAVFGPGAACVRHDVLWYADLPKRFAEAAVSAGDGRNLAQPEGIGPPTSRRLLFIDWPLLDRHRDSIGARIDRYLDTQDPASVTSVDGATLRGTLLDLARRPFRLRPTFSTQPWGGHWAQRELRMSLNAPNTALGYELIAQEGGLLVGDSMSRQVEVPFQLLVSLHPGAVLGERVHELFGTSFPIRFDYLDTADGGNLSVHCHPRPDYMTSVFGFPYPQHETYYVMVGGESSRIFLGLRDNADVDAFHREAHDADANGHPFDIEQYVQSHPAVGHQLFAIPSGTPHGSGQGNVVLEISSTPYLYSLRFYDWLRLNSDGSLRPIHVEQAFANLNTARMGAAVRKQLVRAARPLLNGPGWQEELLARQSEIFFEVRRVVLDSDASASFDPSSGFHVINVVEGVGVIVTTGSAVHELSYAETLVIPAAAGPYSLRRLGTSRVRVIKALVR